MYREGELGEAHGSDTVLSRPQTATIRRVSTPITESQNGREMSAKTVHRKVNFGGAAGWYVAHPTNEW